MIDGWVGRVYFQHRLSLADNDEGRNVDPESSPIPLLLLSDPVFFGLAWAAWALPTTLAVQPIALYLQVALALCAALQRDGIRSNISPQCRGCCC
jgi:hypothetical protein